MPRATYRAFPPVSRRRIAVIQVLDWRGLGATGRAAMHISGWVPTENYESIYALRTDMQTPRSTWTIRLLPMTTVPYRTDTLFAVAVGAAGGHKTGVTSYVRCDQPKSFDWRMRGGKPHSMKRVGDAPFAEILLVLNQVMQLA